ncbi:hypothetical protein PIB30_034185 [Stylosanthes scabra]|uniref:Uncharacterized protein n=1 Tax=Stylosanthes scabra TaxID=79078 RepID=A0ABU6QD99_9FABA|nr:hypothetical protein [Stylosanthes scabra]
MCCRIHMRSQHLQNGTSKDLQWQAQRSQSLQCPQLNPPYGHYRLQNFRIRLRLGLLEINLILTPQLVLPLQHQVQVQVLHWLPHQAIPPTKVQQPLPPDPPPL